MKILTGVILFLFLSALVHAQEDKTIKDNTRITKARYYQDFLNFATDKPGITRLDIFIQVSYDELTFVKTGQQFESNYMVSITVYDEKKEKILTEKTFNEKIDVDQFSQTNSRNNFNISMRSFELTPGKYLIRTSIEDKESKKPYASENVFTVRDFSKKPAVSDMMFIAKTTVSQGSNRILPNITRDITAQKEGIPLFFEVYSNARKNIKIEFDISLSDKKIVYKDTLSRSIDSGRTQIFYTVNPKEISLGSYLLSLNLKDDQGGNASSSYKSFISRWAGLPSTIIDLDKAVAQLVYIATSSEKSFIEKATTREEKIKRYLDFWKKKDPVPSNEENEVFDEYYRRINYTDENFSHYVEGWKTDRGMVYIILGPPNNVDRHPFDYDSKPYEVWEYYELNKSFIFVDETGFGDFKLTEPLYGDFFRYRY